MKGLKDHEIQELTNKLRRRLSLHLPKLQCLREIISSTIVHYLESNNLRIDKP